MAPKRLLERPPPADSSSEDESETDTADNEENEEEAEEQNGVAEGEKSSDDEDTEEEEEEDGDDDEKLKSPAKKKPTVSQPNVSGSGSETESDGTPPSPSLSGFTIKPIVSKPVDTGDSAKPKQKVPAQPNNKRESVAGESDSKEKKKRKVASSGGGEEDENEDPRKVSGAAVRVWSEDDEVALLKGMSDYKAKKGIDPNSDMGAFHEYIKKKLNAEVSKAQLADKIRRLKKKYQNNAARSENEEDPIFSKPHDLRSFQLSKKVWGGIGAASKTSNNGSIVEDKDSKSDIKRKKQIPSTPKINSSETVLALPRPEATVKKEKKTEKVQANGKVKAEKEDEKHKEEEVDDDEEGEDEDGYTETDEEEEEEDPFEKYPFLMKSLMSENVRTLSFMKEYVPLLESSLLENLDNKWKELQTEEASIHVRVTELIKEQSKLVLDNIKNL